MRLIQRWLTRLDHILVRNSGLFDAEHYLDAYPDVARAGLSALAHYCGEGRQEERMPGPLFDPAFVAASGKRRRFPAISPLAEWVVLGRWRGRPTTYPEVSRFLAGDCQDAPPRCDIAFVLHECTRTGAPIFLLRLARWLRDDRGWAVRIVILGYGPLLEVFCREFDCVLVPAIPPDKREARLRAELAGCPYLYFNSVASLAARRWTHGFAGKAIVHVHESRGYIEGQRDAIAQAARDGASFITVNSGTVPALQALAPMGGSEIVSIPPAVSIGEAPRLERRDPTLIIGCGTVSRRKGADLFCQVACDLLAAGYRNFRMVWIGGPGDIDMTGLIAKLGLRDHVRWIGEIPDPAIWFEAAAMLMVPSREDPFPLVCLEAAERGMPTLCFDVLADGIGRFVQDDAGVLVPAFDTEAMASALRELLRNPAYCLALGANARERVVKSHGIDRIGTDILEILRSSGETTHTP